MNSYTAVSLLFLFGCLGCSESVRLRVVDSETDALLPGVSVTRHSEFRDLLLGERDEDKVVGATDAKGAIVVSDLGRGMKHWVRFKKNGYATAVAVTSRHSDTVTVVSSERANNPELDGGINAKKSEVVVIPMHRN